ncbi:MAG TPA: hypothetical protein PKA60_03085 [Candidatus Paceibacterota bacterium]|nr:hypothetical protein [Candidatus Paceibacterota bacterium]
MIKSIMKVALAIVVGIVMFLALTAKAYFVEPSSIESSTARKVAEPEKNFITVLSVYEDGIHFMEEIEILRFGNLPFFAIAVHFSEVDYIINQLSNSYQILNFSEFRAVMVEIGYIGAIKNNVRIVTYSDRLNRLKFVEISENPTHVQASHLTNEIVHLLLRSIPEKPTE